MINHVIRFCSLAVAVGTAKGGDTERFPAIAAGAERPAPPPYRPGTSGTGEETGMTMAAENLSRPSRVPDKVSVIANSVLLSHRIRELQRRRAALMEQQEHLRMQLPDWAIEPLRLVGMTGEEVKSLVDDWSAVETEAGLNGIEQRLDEIDGQIEDVERMLVDTPSASLDDVLTVLGLAIQRFREFIVTDPGDVFYDHGEDRLLQLLERVQMDLTEMVRRERLDAG